MSAPVKKRHKCWCVGEVDGDLLLNVFTFYSPDDDAVLMTSAADSFFITGVDVPDLERYDEPQSLEPSPTKPNNPIDLSSLSSEFEYEIPDLSSDRVMTEEKWEKSFQAASEISHHMYLKVKRYREMLEQKLREYQQALEATANAYVAFYLPLSHRMKFAIQVLQCKIEICSRNGCTGISIESCTMSELVLLTCMQPQVEKEPPIPTINLAKATGDTKARAAKGAALTAYVNPCYVFSGYC